MHKLFTTAVVTLFFSCFTMGQITVTDMDGNIYSTLLIGDRLWMVENLNTSKFQNGDLIPQAQRVESGNAAWYHYDDDAANGAIYGKLYNGYAVADERGLCPAGWHVANAEEMDQLIAFVDPQVQGNNNLAGAALKSRRQVNSIHGGEYNTLSHPRWDEHPTRVGNDNLGFSFLPAGAFVPGKGFSNRGSYGYLWTASRVEEDLAAARVMIHSHRGVSASAYPMKMAMSVRCTRVPEVPMYRVALTAQPIESGEILGEGHYLEGQPVNLSAQPAQGYEFSAWTNEQGTVISTLPEYSFTMNTSSVNLIAVFKPIDYTVRSFPWIESFEGETFPPSGWTSVNESGAASQWLSSSEQNHTASGESSAWHNFGPFQEGMQKGWLVTRAIDIPTEGVTELSFWSLNQSPSWYYKNRVLVSTSSSKPSEGDYAEVWSPEEVSSRWTKASINLSEFAGKTIYIAFVYEGQDAHIWFLDEVEITVNP